MLIIQERKATLQKGNDIASLGSPRWKHSELLFEKKGLISSLQQLLVSK